MMRMHAAQICTKNVQNLIIYKLNEMAEREGFEPSVELVTLHSLSRRYMHFVIYLSH